MSAPEERPLTVPSTADAERWMRDLGILGKLEVAEIAPGGVRKPVWLASLLDMAEFLLASDAAEQDTRDVVRFVDPKRVVEWTRETVGDTELADRMEEVIASGGGYLQLAPRLGRLTLSRVVQCWDLIKAKDEAP